jgi:branched-subunit amino acid aminotransferase/4-amino-4-deoxychorismate lyase
MLLKNNGLNDIPFVERQIALSDLESATQVFVCNSLAGCVPVRQFEQRHWAIDAALMNPIWQLIESIK